MILRPVPARWFELLVARRDCTLALEILARTGAVQLEARAPGEAVVPLAEIKEGLENYQRLAGHYGSYWPKARLRPAPLPASSRDTLARAMRRIHAWRQEAEPVIRQLQLLQSEQSELRLWRDVSARLRDSALDFSLLAQAGPALGVYVAVLPKGAGLTLPGPALVKSCTLDAGDCVLAVGPAARMSSTRQQIAALKGRCVALPEWLQPRAEDNLYHAAVRLASLNAEIARLESELAVLHRRHALVRALTDVARIEWLIAQVPELRTSENFAWITGWTSEPEGGSLFRRLHRAQVRALLHFPEPPADVDPPLLLRNPRWARPFEMFARALGMPAAHEADPSRLLALIVPLLFGYMFGDVGQGLVMALGGMYAQRRWPIARLVLAGGLSAMAFGALFGSVFSREDLLPALWLRPMEAPLTVLAVPLFGGFALLMLGLSLNALQADWRGMRRRWWLTDAGLLLLYAGVVSSFLDARASVLAFAGLCWSLGGHLWLDPRWGTLFAALGEALEHTFQLLVNTLSFVRVGAFALAHAGLSAAVVSLAQAAPGPASGFLVMCAGNALILVLEGLVVSVQTTRLVLFEFFVRFLRGEGRVFRPLPAPPYYVSAGSHFPAHELAGPDPAGPDLNGGTYDVAA
jgi:V/A-type H+/Na+-transporting ATPase subunit I